MAGILDRISARLGRKPLSPEELESRFTELKRSAEPAVAPAMDKETMAMFLHQANYNLFEISHVDDLAAAMAAFETPLPLALSPQPEVRDLPWQANGFSFCDDVKLPVLAVIRATAGIAETGTITISSKEAPSALLYLSEELLVILDKSDVVPLMDDVWRTIAPVEQRALNLISGPSRTADVEQTLQVGAHGPRRVYLWLVSQ